MENRKIGLSDPTVTPETLCKNNGAAVFHNVHYHLEIVVAPDVPEIVTGVFDTSPFSVFVKPGFILKDITETAFPVGFAVPEITKGFLDFFLIKHLPCPP